MTDKLSPPCKLFTETLSKLESALELKEVLAEDGGPILPLISHAPFHDGRCGQVRVFESPHIYRVVTCTLVAPAIHLDSHMVFAFADSDSAMPHFTLDSVKASDHFAFHLDLIPRVDLGGRRLFKKWAFAPLNALYETSYDIEGLTRAHISPLQNAIMSPWMLVHRASEEAFTRIDPLVDGYINHWLSLVKSGVPKNISNQHEKAYLAARDKVNKSLIFDPEIDKVWNQIRGLIGEDAVEETRGYLKATNA